MALPGPLGFLRDVTGDVQAGRSVVVVVPDHMVGDGSADAIIDQIQRATAAADCSPSAAESDLPGVIGALFGNPDAWRRTADPWRDLVGWDAWHGERVILRSWEHDVRPPMRRLPALLHESGIPEPERPVLVFVVRRQDIDEHRLDHLDELTIRVHWWWGVLDRLDTEAYLAGVEHRSERDPLRRAVLAEISAWSLDLADHLAAHWNGRTPEVAAVLDEFVHSRDGELRPTAGVSPRSSFPVATDRDAWDAGLVEQWDGRRRAFPWQVSRQQLETLLWRAQNRVLMPRIDECRADLEVAFRRRASQVVITEVAGRSEVLELGPMRWALGAFGVRMDTEDARRLRTICDLRNKLAHGCPADDTLLASSLPYLHS